jgi:hypothetical protein
MRTGRALIISAILALGATGPVLVSSATTTTAGHAPDVHVLATTPMTAPGVFYHS